jgi:hypothetical protein
MLKEVVSHEGGSAFEGKAAVSPFIYVDENGKQRRGRKGKTWQPGGPKAGVFGREGPPGMVSGAGMQSIGYQIVNKDFDAGTITLRIGVDDSAPGGFTTLQSYLFAWDTGIRSLAKGELKGKASGTVRQKPWLRVTISRYWSEFAAIVILRARGLA